MGAAPSCGGGIEQGRVGEGRLEDASGQAPVAVVIGAGNMGTGVAAAFLAHGWRVQVVDPAAAARGSLPARIAALTGATEQRLSVAAQLHEVDWTGVRFVCESAAESLAVKQQVFAQLAVLAPNDIPLTSNSSTLPMKDIAAGLERTSNMLGAHFLMPAHAVPLVEVLDTGTAQAHIVESTIRILQGIGKQPIRLKREVPGFLVNRMQAALMREALALVDQGVASARDVDMAVRFGFGFRYAACGPIVQKEHSGWDISHKLYETVFPTLCNDSKPAAVLQKMIDAGDYGMKTGQGFVRWDQASMARERGRFNKAMGEASALVRESSDDEELDWR